MSNNTQAPEPIAVNKPTKEYMSYPPRIAFRIEDTDWNRWMRHLSNIPKHDTLFRDISFLAFGVCIPSLLSGVVILFETPAIPEWVAILNFSVFTLTLIIGILVSIYTRKCSTHIHPHCASNLRQQCATFATGLNTKRVNC